MPATSNSFGDLLDSRFKKIFYERYDSLPSKLKSIYDFTDVGPQKNQTRYSEVGTFSNFVEFTGNLNYDDLYQGYDTTITSREFAKGFQIERKLYDDDLTSIMDARPKGLATAAQRSREVHGANIFNLGFSVDNYFQTGSDGVALFSNSHTTTSGASTATGFDNLATAACSAVAVAAGRLQMIGYRDDRANRISVMPDLIVHPPDLDEVVFEITKSQGKVDSANNNANFNEGQYKSLSWNYLTDTNNWFMADETMMKDALKWIDRIKLEFGWVEDFDTFVAKYRAYQRYACGYTGWRWGLGYQVA